MINKRRSAAVLFGLLATTALIGPVPARADDETAEPPKVELVLDVSGSMRARDIDGRSRISVAQQAFNEVVDALPDETQLGIRVLGATYRGKDKKQGCLDTQQIVPVGPVDRTQAKAAVATLRPTGFTPVGLALRSAAQDLGTGSTARRIVLITDGEDTCAPPDPCEVARELAAQGTRLVVDTLGLAPDEKVRRQLLCIAGATGGTYTAAQSADELTGRIKQLVDRARDTYTAAPTVVGGSAACGNAPLLGPGVYTDREAFSEHRWYRVPVRPGQELRASVSVALDRPVNPDYGVLLRATASDGRELVRGVDAGSGRTDVIATGLRWSAAEDTPAPAPSGTVPAQTVCLVVSNAFAPRPGTEATPGMPLELTVDVVAASPAPDGPDLGRGWALLLLLSLAGLVTGLVAGLLTRWWVATWREK
ncbi:MULTISPECIES: VWA domain-containing protein [Micromonospora]|uniref:VWA domain-containing protein n=1 Tax=Micromonospora solifontis TaxID=2487138 RepID=A0ABX9WG52_9ACTN|nr:MULTISPECIES: VWA domain-containing protein [Micromonospora]NES14216.1 VWA domain-containing protein [Micromonospora sp. PPF5-17B]NES37652.1 VWA domain-containing protein [Micromonospora solifontis]NES55835.1 VWA domain-containing protein [Micromonospora sp. PPF5-6]RNL98095.1 VWA domain-containing protein [Micromonospora solifontis]